jgi:hypothetical protein
MIEKQMAFNSFQGHAGPVGYTLGDDILRIDQADETG